jgi:hypothetical protein
VLQSHTFLTNLPLCGHVHNLSPPQTQPKIYTSAKRPQGSFHFHTVSTGFVHLCAGIAQSVLRLGYRLDGRQGSILGGGKIFLFSTASRPAVRPIQPPILWVLGVVYLGVKRQGREADHSPPSRAEIKNDRAVSPLPHTSSSLNA